MVIPAISMPLALEEDLGQLYAYTCMIQIVDIVLAALEVGIHPVYEVE